MLKIVCEICGSDKYIIHRAVIEIPSKIRAGKVFLLVEVLTDICEDCFYEHKAKLIAAGKKTITEKSSTILREWAPDNKPVA